MVTADTKLKSLEQDREKIMYAAELIAGEVGKMEALSQHVVYAMNESTESNEEAIKTFYKSKFAVNMVSNLKTRDLDRDLFRTIHREMDRDTTLT